jgi:ABC-type transport system involved in multi-copper enzyme maturation permease subunit
MRLFVAGLRKLVRRPASWISLALVVLLNGLIVIAVGATARQAAAQGEGGEAAILLVTFPGAYSLLISFLLGIMGLFGVIYGAAIAGSEWNWGTLKAAVARGESRSRYQLLGFASIAVMVAAGLLLAFVAVVGEGLVGAMLAGVPTDGVTDTDALADLPELLGRAWLAIVEETALGCAFATLARSQLAGIGAGIGIYFGASFASIFLPDIVKWAPFQAADAMVAVPGEFAGGGALERLDPNTALLVVVAWLVGALVVACLFTERAEITG